MDDVKVAGALLSFFVESYETAGNNLSVALYNLARHSHIQDELATRIAESMAANNNEITYELIHKHEYLDMVASGKNSAI